jgi:hypothetical protein
MLGARELAARELEAAREQAAALGVREAELNASQRELVQLQAAHEALRSEYAKLQIEYNEWIDLLENPH